jgi:CheY-like chemotaxis protein
MHMAIVTGADPIGLGGLNTLEWVGVVSVVAWAVYGLALWIRCIRPTPEPGPVSHLHVGHAVPERGNGHETVLVVEDDPDVLLAHTRLINSMGYKVREARSGKEALEVVKEEQPDLVVLDLLMPEQDGVEAFEAIRKVRPDQRAIVLSGYAGPSMVHSIHALGVHTYLVKPVDSGLLARAIRDELDRGTAAAWTLGQDASGSSSPTPRSNRRSMASLGS